jgi:hypothetical protein
LQPETAGVESAFSEGWGFVRRNRGLVLAMSVLVMLPCWWHRHIEAGDLGSHVYNAWLAQLIAKGQAPGLYVARQWNNILFDVALLHVGNWVGLAAAEKIVVSACVLIFFWGVFAFAGAVSGRAPWLLAPCVAMLTYGYSFNMGFLNYYLSIGLGCFCLTLLWRGPAGNWVAALCMAGLALLAHPIGFLWVVGTLAYLAIRRGAPGNWNLLAPAGVAISLMTLRWYLHVRKDIPADYESLPRYQLNGADQLITYGDRYATLAWLAVGFGLICFGYELIRRRRDVAALGLLILPLELYAVTFCATSILPENIRLSLYAAWVGLLVSRLTTVSAIFGLCVLGGVVARWWQAAGFGILAACFFVFLYQDTGTLNRMEASAEEVLAGAAGNRIIPTVGAPPDWRVEFVGHVADRACVGRCFVYSNYEPSSRQFRVRVRPGGSWLASSSADDADDMQGGGYEMQAGDLPMKQLYQCDRADWTKLCLRDLAEGQSTGAIGFRPGR